MPLRNVMETGDKATNAQMERRIAIKLIQENRGTRNEKRRGLKRAAERSLSL